MAAMPSSGDITPPESRPKDTEKSRRAQEREMQYVDRAIARATQCLSVKYTSLK